MQLNGAAPAPRQLGAPGAAAVPAVVSAGGSDALWVTVEEGAGAEAAVEAGVVNAVRRLLPQLAIDVRADLQARACHDRFLAALCLETETKEGKVCAAVEAGAVDAARRMLSQLSVDMRADW